MIPGKTQILKSFVRQIVMAGVFTSIYGFSGLISTQAQELGPCTMGLRGNFELRFSMGPFVYRGFLSMKGCTGEFVVGYFDNETKKTEKVYQTMEIRSSSLGIVLLGKNPVYADTGKPHPSYYPDNFLFQQEINGSWNIATFDVGGNYSPVEIIQYETESESSAKRLYVQWTDHAIRYDGILEINGEQAKTYAKLYDIKTQRFLIEQEREMNVNQTPEGISLQAVFSLPWDSTTPESHEHLVNLVFQKQDDNSLTVQNCNQNKCYPGKAELVR